MSVIYDIQQLIASDDLATAIQTFISIARRDQLDCLNEAIVMSRELGSLEKRVGKGVMKWEDEKAEKNQLAYRMLKMLAALEDSLPHPNQRLLSEEEMTIGKKSIKRA